jgi:hypothetical protein
MKKGIKKGKEGKEAVESRVESPPEGRHGFAGAKCCQTRTGSETRRSEMGVGRLLAWVRE